MTDNKELLTPDLYIKTVEIGGFVFVDLWDWDDDLEFTLNESDIVPLRDYLNKVIEKHKL